MLIFSLFNRATYHNSLIYMTPFLIGILFGFFKYNYEGKIKINSFILFIGEDHQINLILDKYLLCSSLCVFCRLCFLCTADGDSFPQLYTILSHEFCDKSLTHFHVFDSTVVLCCFDVQL